MTNDKNSKPQRAKVKNYFEGVEKDETRRERRVTKNRQRRNHNDKAPRERDWEPDLESDDDPAADERAMPRRAAEQRNPSTPGRRSGSDSGDDSQIEGRQGIVVEASSGLCRVRIDDETLLCKVRGTLLSEDTGFANVLAVGDQVIVSDDGAGNGVVEAALPRESVLARPDTSRPHLRQAIVANAEQLLIVSSWMEPPIWLELIDRYLIAAQSADLRPVICINKIDLATDPAEVEVASSPYRDLGYPVVSASAHTGQGLDRLRTLLRGRVTVLAGMSGVGKSSLLSSIQPDLDLRTADVNEISGEGRHTTTQARMFPLDAGGFVVDTPGIREFGLAGLYRSDLSSFYPEIIQQAEDCRFTDCSHVNEPDCAVRNAVAENVIAASRYHSYEVIRATLPDSP